MCNFAGAMKRISLHSVTAAILLAGCALACLPATAQHSHAPQPARKKRVVEPSYAWTALQPLGLHEPATIDTLMHDYHRLAIPAEQSDAWACTGNLGAEGMNMLYMHRRPMSPFFLMDALSAWTPYLPDQKFYNTRIPMTLLAYNTGGGRDNAQDRLQGVFSGNINSRAQVGANLDYLYSKGSYNYQATKDLMWGASGSYMGDRYEFQGSWQHFNLLNKENGGITDDRYITDPAALQGGVSNLSPKSIPTRLTAAHTKVVGGELLLNSRYKVGHWHEEQIDDTTTRRTYIPVTSFIWTLNYSDAKHIFHNTSARDAEKFFAATYLNPQLTDDRTRYWRLSNTVGVSMLEGFHRLAKFGLAAYATYELRDYRQTADTLRATQPEGALTPWPAGIGDIAPYRRQSLAWVGAQLTKQRGSILTYQATAELGIAGDAAGEVKAAGSVTARIPLLGDSVAVTGQASFANTSAPYLMQSYLSNHFIWQNTFGKERRVRLGGSVAIPRLGTEIEVLTETGQNLIYFGPDATPQQRSGSVQTFWARIHQPLRLGILHWDNTVTYQTTSDDAVIPLPALAVYSNLYIRARIATLQLQLGVSCDYYTRYHAPAYQPATATFYNQRELQTGNYPLLTLYANMKLSKVRFYVMMSHINQGWTGTDYFSIPHYPINPRRFQLGLSIDFAN